MAHREISPEQLRRILEEHQKWLESEGKEGEGADLSNADLRKVNLRGVNLAEANLQNADLSEADLSEAIFSKAILCETNFTKAKLCYANLQGTSCILPRQLAGTNLSCAKLPDVTLKFEELAITEEASKNAGKLFVLILLGCIYSVLTIATASDAQLFTHSETSSLPIIGNRIPIFMFYIT